MNIQTEIEFGNYLSERSILQCAKRRAIGQTGKLAFPVAGVVHFVFVTREDETTCSVTSTKPLPKPVPHWGIALWRELHEAAWADRLTEDFLYAFDLRIPDFCACRNHWKKIRFDFPLVRDAKHWSVDVHNQVNLLLHKPQFTYEEADQIYAKS